MNQPLIKKEKKKNKPNLIYNSLSFYSYSDDKKFDNFSFESKYSYLLNCHNNLQRLIVIKWTNLGKVKGKEKVDITLSGLYNKRLKGFYDGYNELSDAKRYNLHQKFKPRNLKLKDYDYDEWFTEEELDDEEKLDDLPPLEGDEQVKEGKGLKVLTPNNLLTRLSILLTQIKNGKN